MKWPLVLTASVLLCGCHSPTSPSPSPGPGPIDTPPGILVGAADIVLCGTPGAELTARLLDQLSGTVFTAGDNAYMAGTADEFNRCYGPTWGRHRGRTRPVPGNHDYGTPGASAFFDYFGASAGERGLGYYSYTVGPWRIVALNSEINAGAGSPQMQWLRSELSTNRAACTLAIWHRPLFSSGLNGDNPDMREIWRTLYEFGAEVVINGHDHQYERFAPQDPDGRADPARGIRQFTVGTGGVPLYQLRGARPNTEVLGSAFGVIALTLGSGTYQWEFIPAEGSTLRDSGLGVCH
jgi:3',5'-cyclic AMP phosphodiesterase CpdA